MLSHSPLNSHESSAAALPQNIRSSFSGWTASNHERIATLLAQLSSADAVVFDLDHTLQPIDIGDGAFKRLTRHRAIVQNTRLMPIQVQFNYELINKITDPWQRYLAACSRKTADTSGDHDVRAAYEWIVTASAGARADEIIHATQEAHIELMGALQSTGKNLPPPLYPELVELLGKAEQRGATAYVVSASNSLSVRWIVHNVLNPELLHRGYRALPPERVFGMAPKYRGADGKAYEERQLLKEPAFGRLDMEYLSNLLILPVLSRPSTGFEGKRITIEQHITKHPTCVVGDSPGDLQMMSIAKRCVWMAQLEKPLHQQRLLSSEEFIQDQSRFIIQPALHQIAATLVSTPESLLTLEATLPPALGASLDKLGVLAFG